MYAVLRLNSFDPDVLAASSQRLREFDQVHSSQPGFVGSLAVDLGSGRRFLVNLWESEEASRAALEQLLPEVQRLLEPLLAAPSEFVGAGPVVSEDLRVGHERIPGDGRD